MGARHCDGSVMLESLEALIESFLGLYYKCLEEDESKE